MLKHLAIANKTSTACSRTGPNILLGGHPSVLRLFSLPTHLPSSGFHAHLNINNFNNCFVTGTARYHAAEPTAAKSHKKFHHEREFKNKMRQSTQTLTRPDRPPCTRVGTPRCHNTNRRRAGTARWNTPSLPGRENAKFLNRGGTAQCRDPIPCGHRSEPRHDPLRADPPLGAMLTLVGTPRCHIRVGVLRSLQAPVGARGFISRCSSLNF